MKEWCHINTPDPELSVYEAQKNLFNRPINMYRFMNMCEVIWWRETTICVA